MGSSTSFPKTDVGSAMSVCVDCAGVRPAMPLVLQGYPISLTAEEVLAKNPESVRGKTALVTGGNSVRIANVLTAAVAFASVPTPSRCTGHR